MTGLDSAIRKLVDERRQLENSWDSTRGNWSDSRREEFEGTIVMPLVRATADTVREMEAISLLVQSALAML